MKLKLFQVDAFTDRLFAGNPAAVVPLQRWPEAGLMQAIAQENNLSETAFFLPLGDRVQLRWFTPLTEVDLCGHATLACAHVLFEHLAWNADSIVFGTRSGALVVERAAQSLRMDFPARPALDCDAAAPSIAQLGAILGATPSELFTADDYLAVFDDEATVAALQPDFAQLARLPRRGLIATAPGRDCDFVSRFFAPQVGILEDPVTGSAHCTLAPYWAARLGRCRLFARQISRRGGTLQCEVDGGRVVLFGTARTFMTGEIHLDPTVPGAVDGG